MMGDVVQMVPIVPNLPYPEILDWFRSLSTEQLKGVIIHCVPTGKMM
jgi:hypothetical protein